ncbi:hypothetical protein [Dyadobacter luticola]|nr:hypothetical protein [Dyadobacter luticola]
MTRDDCEAMPLQQSLSDQYQIKIVIYQKYIKISRDMKRLNAE